MAQNWWDKYPSAQPAPQSSLRQIVPPNPTAQRKREMDIRQAEGDLARQPYQIQGDQVGVQKGLADLADRPLVNQGRQLDITSKQTDQRLKPVEFGTKLLESFRSDPVVKAYREVLPAMAGAMQAGDDPTGDTSVIYAWAKAMDPAGSVREGDTDLAVSGSTYSQRAKQLLGSLSGGKRLPPEIRNGLISEMRNKAIQLNRSYTETFKNYRTQAERAGLPVDILGNHEGDAFHPIELEWKRRNGIGAPAGALAPAGQFEIANPDAVKGKRIPAELEAEFRRFYATKPSPQQINAWFDEAGFPGAANADQLAQAAARGAPFGGFNYGKVDEAYQDYLRKEQAGLDDVGAGASDGRTIFNHGATFGLSDEAAGVGRGLSHLISGKNPITGYQLGRDTERLNVKDARSSLGGAGTALEIGGGLVGANPTSLLRLPTLGGRVRQGAKSGAVGGGVAGFGYGEGENSLVTGGAGAVGGAALGAAFPIGGHILGNRFNGVRQLVGADPALPRRLVSEAIQADGHAPAQVGRMMDEAHGRGSPMFLGDTGDNTRALLASVGRQPGPSRTLTRGAVIPRQEGQGERIGGAISRDLGPVVNLHEARESLIEQARAASRPLYEAFEAAPGASVINLQDIAARPSFQKALHNAVRTAQEEGVDPTTLGFTFNEAGDVLLNRDAASWRTLDAVKKGLDDVVEGYRDSTTGRLNLTTGEARATEATRKALIARMDAVNPHYAPARQAYSGPVSIRTAMDKGYKALNRQPDDVWAMMRNMSEAEQEGFRMGIRKGMSELVSSKRDGADKVAHLLGTPKMRGVLTRVFGGRGNFDRFVQTLRDEQAMGETYRSVTGNSATAERLAQDAMTQDGGLLDAAADSAIRGARQGSMLGGMIGDALESLQAGSRFGFGQAGQRTRESIAALLSETDPAVLRELMQAARMAAAQQRRSHAVRGRRAVRVGSSAGDLTGMGLGRMTEKEPRK